MNQPARHLRRPDARPGDEGRDAAPRHLRVVESPPRSAAWRRRRARIALVTAGGMAVAVMFGLVYLHVVLAQRQIELDRLTTVVSSRQHDYQALRLEVSGLESPAQIISAAEGRLGMRQPSTVTYVTPPESTLAPHAAGAAASATGTSASGTSATGTSPTGAAPEHGVAAALSGNADWPKIKAELAGRP